MYGKSEQTENKLGVQCLGYAEICETCCNVDASKQLSMFKFVVQ